MGLLTKLLHIPSNEFGWMSYITGFTGALLYMTQMLWPWFGRDNADRTLFSFIVLILMIVAIASMYVGNNAKHLKNPMNTLFEIIFVGFIGVLLVVIVLNGVAMTLSTTYKAYANKNYGFFTGMRYLTHVTQEDLNDLQNWALGLKQIIKALFLIVPFLTGTWGGLSVLTADSIDEAEGGILAIVAAFVVVIIVWLFKLVEVSLA